MRSDSLGLDLGVEADELFVIQPPVAVAVVASDQFDRLVNTEAQLSLKHVVCLLDRHDPVTVTIKLDELAPHLGASSINQYITLFTRIGSQSPDPNPVCCCRRKLHWQQQRG